MTRRRKRQTTFHFRTHGGKRKGAGRKRVLAGPRRASHRARPTVSPRFPIHVTSRIRDDIPRLRNRKRCKVIRAALLAVMDATDFRICEFSVQGNHLHLICEADNNAALAKGLKRFKLRVARGLNRQLGGRKGSVFYDRYHMQLAKTPRQVRNTLCYVLHNARRHRTVLPTDCGGIDPFSSAWWFTGWAHERWKRGLAPPDKPCVSGAHSWLLKQGWRAHGLIGPTEIPPAGRE